MSGFDALCKLTRSHLIEPYKQSSSIQMYLVFSIELLRPTGNFRLTESFSFNSSLIEETRDNLSKTKKYLAQAGHFERMLVNHMFSLEEKGFETEYHLWLFLYCASLQV